MVGSHSCAHSPERRSGWLGSSSSCPPTRGETSAGTSAASSPHCQERATAWKVALARRRCGGMQQKRRGEGGRGHNLRAQVPWKGEVAIRRDLYSHYLRALGGRKLLPSHGFVYPTWFVRVYPLVSKCGRHGGVFEARGARIPRDSGADCFLFSSVSSPADSKVVGCACARQEPPLLRWH